MYCPTCFSDTLKLSSRGVVKLSFNGKSKDTSLFLYNLQKESSDEIKRSIQDKIEEFFKWYSSFQSKDPIKNIELYSSDYTCTNNCKIPLNTRITVTGLLISTKELQKMCQDLGQKYQVPVQLKF